ncbi:MAG: cysteine-rich CWC family protein [Ignavibacteriae bacterium]|nr:cysteine-rich CWC family protein [Ignavibacteriota bacterium]
MKDLSKYELKYCPRCISTFECKPGNITQCQCFEFYLTKQELIFIKDNYKDCLCGNCLNEIKSRNQKLNSKLT